ncbi:leukocyte surface antigen CD53-like [Venturia canescens]|uniref:leukocyte surface antigen CD53-like n=1 Tax=Venturia canescens TaxID=32260 RepID=UPI001C9CC817|nr:leukocyte surface antigen CD53-like [Venturia canescens]XP_043271325.1 leukocyte surface antigen CD53-like [Venturia canescens]XP_043271336.1 leukocyte surface antigen CD53-like [Venturia canescens]XP_043271345.1 leukocyte surface antigen CD53-like [Venturia canescens]XP_043271353.1 leukocyte surface antigen CD53-like [Venturia canescens]
MEMKYWKIAVFLFNLCIWLTGCMVLVVGVWLLLDPSNGYLFNLFVENTTPHETIYLVSYSILGLGSVVLTVGFFGCQASLRGNQCILAIYMTMLIILIAAELAVVSVGSFMSVRTTSGLEGRLLNRLAEHYGHDSTSDIAFSHSLDFAQYKFNCCGIYGDGDYNQTAWWRDGQYSGTKRHVPLTCCVLKNPEVKNAGSPMSVVSRVFHKDNEKPWLHPQPRDEAACQVLELEAQEGYRHKEGCLDKATNWLRAESLKLIVIGLFVAGIQTAGVLCSAMLCRRIREVQEN